MYPYNPYPTHPRSTDTAGSCRCVAMVDPGLHGTAWRDEYWASHVLALNKTLAAPAGSPAAEGRGRGRALCSSRKNRCGPAHRGSGGRASTGTRFRTCRP